MYTEWTPDMSFGIGEIDVQHRKMVRKINEISEAIDKSLSHEEIIEAIKYFEAYSEEHFRTEEGYMTMYKYPDYPEHKKTHEMIMKDTAEIRERFSDGKADAREVYAESRKIAEWFVNHMKTTDTRLAGFLRGKVK
jgi:hemerythrin